ncbi:hypothetical protein ABW20_dc0103725 [Dactylellina cionopaga]|nr:hypothetical protein ABW20_dc0103725 [Dactylellina cionopaga]
MHSFTPISFYVASCFCIKLSEAFKGENKVSFPLSLSYITQNTYWSTTSVKTPICIFAPTSATDVSKALKLFSSNSCIFAIRSGGHLPNPGFSSTSNGILVSLTGLDQISYSPSGNGGSGVVYVGSGNRWKAVYSKLDALGITVMGGRSADVGVGGFLLGGGFSYLSNANGWAADNVVDYEVVLANGNIVHANANQNTDLFRSLKGGSSNFGIVTTFTLKAYHVSAITAGLVLYPDSSTPALLQAAYQYTSSGADADPKSHIIPAWVKIGILPTLPSFTVFYSERFSTPPPVVKPYIDKSIPYVLSTVSNQTGISGIAFQLGVGQPDGLRNRWQDCSVVANAELFKTIYNLWTSLAKPYELIPGFINTISIQPIGKKFIQAATSGSNGGNSMGITSPIVTAAKAAGKDSPFEYLNYAGPKQDPIRNYGAESVARLKLAKKKYDPNNVFGTLVEGGFKIPGF